MNKENHYEYTLLALELHEQFNKKTFIPKNTFPSLAQAAWDEDEYNIFTLDLQRILNWHFYNNKNSISNSLIPGQRTSEKRVHKLIRKILEEKIRYRDSFDKIEKKDSLEHLLTNTGRLIHHIQDMSTFSHVVPVYHGPGLKDSYEEYGLCMHGNIKISIDKSPEDNQLYIIFSSDELKEICNRNSECNIEKLFEIYHSAAEETLLILNNKEYGFFISSNKQGTDKKKRAWNCFWKERDDTEVNICPTIYNSHHGFGSFGELCNNFGKKFFNVKDTLYRIDEKYYLKIYRLLMKKSIKDTFSTLFLILNDLDVDFTE